MNPAALKEFLDQKVEQYNTTAFIEPDPVSIPHLFTEKEDQEIAGFLAATIAWGNRKSILKNAHRMMDLLGQAPYDFVMNHTDGDLVALEPFVHRTFNGTDFKTFIRGLKHIYGQHGGLHGVFSRYQTMESLQPAITKLREVFFQVEHLPRTQKHLASPARGSAAKRINMFLRWMVRKDQAGVDFGLWKDISPSKLSCPLDVHSGTVARKLGLLERKQNDARAVVELDTALRSLDSLDPVKYDFALFGLGVSEKF